MLMLCDKNCFACKWDDCINDEITQQDLDELEAMDKALFPDENPRREYFRMKNRQRDKEKERKRKREYRQRRKEKRG